MNRLFGSESQRETGRAMDRGGIMGIGRGAMLGATLILAGCGSGGDGLARESVSGAVTLEGQPLEQGSIQFVPLSPDKGAPAWGKVVNGSYSIPGSEGPVAGEYSV
jgi:hypothetical protein